MNRRRRLPWAVTFGIALLVGHLGDACGSRKVRAATPERSPIVATRRDGTWHIAETANFFVCSNQSLESACDLAVRAERQRDALRGQWFGGAGEDVTWSPRCQLVWHATRAGYTAAVGPGSESTVGSALISVDEGRVVGRRIDLVGNAVDWASSALPHELTHVILRDRFIEGGVPRWADEGAAVLADADEKQLRHRDDLAAAINTGTLFAAVELLSIAEYPPSGRWGTFYAQSVSLAEFLINRRDAVHFVRFLEHAATAGYDAALTECYAISDVRELDRQWRMSLEPAPAAE